jgi:hypothetical protein
LLKLQMRLALMTKSLIAVEHYSISLALIAVPKLEWQNRSRMATQRCSFSSACLLLLHLLLSLACWMVHSALEPALMAPAEETPTAAEEEEEAPLAAEGPGLRVLDWQQGRVGAVSLG